MATGLAVVTFICVTVGVLANRHRQTVAVCEVVAKSGGTVNFASDYDSDGFTRVAGRKLNPTAIPTINALDEVRSIRMDCSKLTPSDWRVLASAPGLDTLVLANATPADLTPISTIRGLGCLGIIRSTMGHGDLETCSNRSLAHLDQLVIEDSTGVKCLLQLARNSRLQYLTIARSDLGPDSYDLIGSQRALEVLDLPGSGVNDSIGDSLLRLRSLRSLNLNLNDISDELVGQLVGLEELKVLEIAGTNVTDASIPSLLQIEQLAFVDAIRTYLSASGVRTLRQKLGRFGVSAGNWPISDAKSSGR